MQKKTILVVTNDQSAKNMRLEVSARVEVVLAVNPARINFPAFISSNGTSEPLYAGFIGSKKDSVSIRAVESANTFINVEINNEGFDGDPGRKIRLRVRPGMQVGRFREKVVFKTDSTSVPELYVYVTGEATGPIVVSPKNLPLGTITPQSTLRKTISVKSLDENVRFTVVDISSTVQELATELIAVIPGKEYRVVVTLQGGFDHQILRGSIIIKTDYKNQERIVVKVFGRAAGSRPSA